ncbi:phospholipid methyltransferase-domain-containing protein [Sphaerosporella brunnea]|uniref:Phosphatidyl-N-methylethanolamine N-methyltransferase n=1 Tax=Sphaerosporella brunnea TaxID=1250544 RepID=A0A5J5ENT0_9PEZI|nr:phospholipid methyltransferase-domain-containing protein [Sphaerosporella brunnea]
MTVTKVYGSSDPMEWVDFSKDSLKIAAASIAFNPIFWNAIARQEYHNKILTKLFCGNARYGCYFLAVVIFSLGIVRDYIYEGALREQPVLDVLTTPVVKNVAAALFITGNILVVTSMWALGVTGTYLGDYFGILMDARVTGFPFNVTDAPMYHGSSLSFLGTALWFGKPAGILLTAWVWLMYQIARQFEDPFTSEIYAKREREREKKRG